MNNTESLAPAQNGHLLALAFEGKPVRILEREGEPWFVANDVGDLLGLARIKDSVYFLDDDQKCRLSTDQLPGLRADTSLVSESGLYELVFRSTKPEAKRFRRWVTSEVLPQIRKTGSYTGTPSGLSKLETALVDLAREHDARIGELESRMRPGADWQSVSAYLLAHYDLVLGGGRGAYVARRCMEESARRKLPFGEEKVRRGKSTSYRRAYAPEVLQHVVPPIIRGWAAKGKITLKGGEQ